MALNVLMVMAESSLSDLIERALEGRGGYNLVYADNLDDALEFCQQTQFDYAFLDIELAEEDLRELSRRLFDTSPDVRLLIVPEEGEYDSLSSLDPTYDSAASDPSQSEDLLAEIAHILLGKQSRDDLEQPLTASPVGGPVDEREANIANSEIKKSHDSTPSWLDDADRAAQKLASMSLSGSVLAAMILREGQLWAYAGQLSQLVAQELALCVTNYWNPDVSSDLARFINLDSGQGEYLLYATGLGKGIVLALAFEIETPFSQIRTQVNGLAEGLRSKSLTYTPQTNITKEQITGADVAGADPIRSQVRKNPMFSLGDVPPPTPSHTNAGSGNKSSQYGVDARANLGNNLDEAAIKSSLDDLDIWAKPNPSAVESRRASDESDTPSSKKHFDGEILPSAGKISTPGEKVFRTQDFTQGTPAFYSLYYSGLLVPRLPEHQLVGELAARLPRIVRQIFLAYGWRLKHIDVKPESLQWIACLPPHIPPGKLVIGIRQHTSERIFADFPRLVSENPSGDFWAPGYLLMSGQSALPERVINYFIAQTRQRQGL